METSCAKTLYTYQKEKNSQVETEGDVLDDYYVYDTLNGRVRYSYTYIESLIMSIISVFSCCLKNREGYQTRLKRHELHEEAMNRLATETDIV